MGLEPPLRRHPPPHQEPEAANGEGPAPPQEPEPDRMEQIMEVMEFFLFAIRPDNKYHGTLSFHFRMPASAAAPGAAQEPADLNNSAGDNHSSSSSGASGRTDGNNQRPQQPLILTVRLEGGAQPVIFQGLPPDGQISAHVHCSLDDFLYIYSGKASVRDVAALGLRGAIYVTGYKFSECSRFAQAFDLSSPMWEAFYASGQQGRLRAEIIQVPPSIVEEGDNYSTHAQRQQHRRHRTTSMGSVASDRIPSLLEDGPAGPQRPRQEGHGAGRDYRLPARTTTRSRHREYQWGHDQGDEVAALPPPYALPNLQAAFESGAWALGQQAQALLEEATAAAATNRELKARQLIAAFLNPSQLDAQAGRRSGPADGPNYHNFLLLPSAPDARPSPAAILAERALSELTRRTQGRVHAMRAGQTRDLYNHVQWATRSGEDASGRAAAAAASASAFESLLPPPLPPASLLRDGRFGPMPLPPWAHAHGQGPRWGQEEWEEGLGALTSALQHRLRSQMLMLQQRLPLPRPGGALMDAGALGGSGGRRPRSGSVEGGLASGQPEVDFSDWWGMSRSMAAAASSSSSATALTMASRFFSRA